MAKEAERLESELSHIRYQIAAYNERIWDAQEERKMLRAEERKFVKALAKLKGKE